MKESPSVNRRWTRQGEDFIFRYVELDILREKRSFIYPFIQELLIKHLPCECTVVNLKGEDEELAQEDGAQPLAQWKLSVGSC